MDTKAPERIWLQWQALDTLELVTWERDQVFDDDTEYIRSDIHAALQAENERLNRVAKAARNIFKVADTKENCPHGNNGRYPTSSWWCDDCFFELEAALAALKASADE